MFPDNYVHEMMVGSRSWRNVYVCLSASFLSTTIIRSGWLNTCKETANNEDVPLTNGLRFLSIIRQPSNINISPQNQQVRILSCSVQLQYLTYYVVCYIGVAMLCRPSEPSALCASEYPIDESHTILEPIVQLQNLEFMTVFFQIDRCKHNDLELAMSNGCQFRSLRILASRYSSR